MYFTCHPLHTNYVHTSVHYPIGKECVHILYISEDYEARNIQFPIEAYDYCVIIPEKTTYVYLDLRS